MGGQKEDLYHNFSRKDLQGLCKKYGLPANKSNSEMATSLILYLEKKNLNSRIIWEATKSDYFPSGTPELQAGRRMSPVGDQGKDIRGTVSCSGSGKNQCGNRELLQNNSLNCKDPATSDKASEEMGASSHFLGDSNSTAAVPEYTFSYVERQPVRAPSPHFQFDVSSEDGIQLYVDLDSSPSDWIEELKVGVHVCSDMHKLDLSSCHPELGRLCCSKQVKDSSLVDSYKEMDNGGVEEGPNLNTTGDAQVEPNGRNSGNSAYGPENLGEEQTTTSSRLENDTEKQDCGAKSFIREGTVLADPDVNTGPLIKTCHNSSGNSSSCDCKCSRVLEIQGLNVGTGIFKKPSSQDIYGPPDSILVCRGSSASTSANILVSSDNFLDQDKVMSLDFADQPQGSEMEHCGLTNSAQFLKCAPKVLLPVETTDQTKCGLSSDWINNSNLLDPAYLRLEELETELGKVSTSSNSSMQSLEPSGRLASSCLKNLSVSPYNNYESQEVVNLPNFVEAENGGIRQHGTGKEAIEMNSCVVIEERKNVSVSSCSNGGSLHSAVPKQNGGGQCTPAYSNKLDEDINKIQPTTLENLGRVNAGDQRKSSECLDFRETMAESWLKLAGSETCRELTRKRQVNSADDRSQSVKPNTKISRTSKQFVRDDHAIRRRSSRFFTK